MVRELDDSLCRLGEWEALREQTARGTDKYGFVYSETSRTIFSLERMGLCYSRQGHTRWREPYIMLTFLSLTL